VAPSKEISENSSSAAARIRVRVASADGLVILAAVVDRAMTTSPDQSNRTLTKP
jgi:hypothetical protein